MHRATNRFCIKNLKVKKKETKKKLNLNASMYNQEFKRLKDSSNLPGGITTLEEFYDYKCKALKNEEAEKNKQEAKRVWDAWKSQCVQIEQKVKEQGFSSLSKHEMTSIASVSEKLFSSEKDLVVEEMSLLETALNNTTIYRYLQLKVANFATAKQDHLVAMQTHLAEQQSAIMLKISEISAKADVLKTGSVVSGMWAAKQLGEDLADSFGE